jgi:putative aldouronate transport system permease protein
MSTIFESSKISFLKHKINPKHKTRMPIDEKIYYTFVYIYLIFLTVAVAYPLIFIVSASFSSPNAVMTGKVILWPVEFSLEGYITVFKNPNVLIGYRNTIFYTVAGTFINIAMTLICAYPLARKKLPHRGLFSFLFAFTMLFSGGMIPNYLLMRDLKILNSIWVMIIPGAISVYNMIVTRTYLQGNIPDELLEATQIDGCNDFKFFFQFVLPLSKVIIAVITMYYAVGHWNAYFNAFIYLSNKKLYPLQIFLREILIQSKIEIDDIVDPEMAIAMQGLADLLKYSLIVVATAPILCVYPFAQKYFVKGVMFGSLKG